VRLLLVHSPLTGPTVWRWVADRLERGGHSVVVPDLRDAACSGEPRAFVDAAADSGDVDVVVGHSGAGPFLPSIANATPAARPTLLFVDAGVPPCAGETSAAADFIDRLEELATDGVLPRWSTWWGPGAMKALVPDEGRRSDIEGELPNVPLEFYRRQFPVPADWCSTYEVAYLLLSDVYLDDATVAKARGWPVTERSGGHLDVVNAPSEISGALVDLARRGNEGDIRGT
jgi:hypothetical protein